LYDASGCAAAAAAAAGCQVYSSNGPFQQSHEEQCRHREQGLLTKDEKTTKTEHEQTKGGWWL